MKKVHLRMNEQEKYDLIKNLVAKNGNPRIASIKLDCSIRTIKRLITKFKTQGKSSFIHGNRGRKPKTTIDEKVKEKIINLYKSYEYNTANFNHFKELLWMKENIQVSYSFFHNLLFKNDILSPKCHRKTLRRKRNEAHDKVKLHPTDLTINPVNIDSDIPEKYEKSARIICNKLTHPRIVKNLFNKKNWFTIINFRFFKFINARSIYF